MTKMQVACKKYAHCIPFFSNKKEEIDGILTIDNSDSDNVNGLFLELKVPIEYITNKKLVTFRTLKENYIRK